MLSLVEHDDIAGLAGELDRVARLDRRRGGTLAMKRAARDPCVETASTRLKLPWKTTSLTVAAPSDRRASAAPTTHMLGPDGEGDFCAGAGAVGQGCRTAGVRSVTARAMAAVTLPERSCSRP